MSKYKLLKDYLISIDKVEVILTYSQIESILENTLPKSAYEYSAWWSNNDKPHIQAKAWLEAGFKTKNVKVGECITFEKVAAENNKLNEIMNEIIKFRDERDWRKFHNPKDLAISVNIEAGELLECFQWKTANEVEELVKGKDKIKIEEEIADIAIYLLLLCNEANIDIKEAIMNKIKKNAEKYPIEKFKGINTKYNEQ